MTHRRFLGAAVAAALLLSAPTVAQADTYVPSPASQDFAGGAGGWVESAGYAGSCVPALLCPTVVNDWAAGGADGNGYIRTTFGSTLATLNGTSTGVWDSPAFTYAGNGGSAPATVTFDMNMRSDIADLLGASQLNDSHVRVDLVDVATGSQISVVPTTLLTASTSWTAIQTASVNPALLALGRSYKIRISASYHSAAAVMATGEVGYDNVRLTTAGQGANGGSGIATSAQLRSLTESYVLPGSARLVGDGTLVGRKLKIKLRCPAAASPKSCKIQVQGLAKGKASKPATARKILTIKAGKSKTVKLRVKPAYLARYQVAKKIWLKSTVRVGDLRVTVRKRVKLKH
jgi:hypothetical protein